MINTTTTGEIPAITSSSEQRQIDLMNVLMRSIEDEKRKGNAPITSEAKKKQWDNIYTKISNFIIEKDPTEYNKTPYKQKLQLVRNYINSLIKYINDQLQQSDSVVARKEKEGLQNQKLKLTDLLTFLENNKPETRGYKEFLNFSLTNLRQITNSQVNRGMLARIGASLSGGALDKVYAVLRSYNGREPEKQVEEFWPLQVGKESSEGKIEGNPDRILAFSEASSFFCSTERESYVDKLFDLHSSELSISYLEKNLVSSEELKKSLKGDIESSMYIYNLLASALNLDEQQAELFLKSPIGVTFIRDDVPYHLAFEITFNKDGRPSIPSVEKILEALQLCQGNESSKMSASTKQELRDLALTPNQEIQLSNNNFKNLTKDSQFVVSFNSSKDNVTNLEDQILTYGRNTRMHLNIQKVQEDGRERTEITTKFAHSWFNGVPAMELHDAVQANVLGTLDQSVNNVLRPQIANSDASLNITKANIEIVQKEQNEQTLVLKREFVARSNLSEKEATNFYSDWLQIKKFLKNVGLSLSPSDFLFFAQLITGRRTGHNIFGNIGGDGKKLDTALFGLSTDLIESFQNAQSGDNHELNRDQLQQLLYSLAENSLRYAGEDGEKELALAGKSTSAVLDQLTKPVQGATVAISGVLNKEETCRVNDEVCGMLSAFVYGSRKTEDVRISSYLQSLGLHPLTIEEALEFRKNFSLEAVLISMPLLKNIDPSIVKTILSAIPLLPNDSVEKGDSKVDGILKGLISQFKGNEEIPQELVKTPVKFIRKILQYPSQEMLRIALTEKFQGERGEHFTSEMSVKDPRISDIVIDILVDGVPDLHVTTAQSSSYFGKKEDRENVIRNGVTSQATKNNVKFRHGGPFSLTMGSERISIDGVFYEKPELTCRLLPHQFVPDKLVVFIQKKLQFWKETNKSQNVAINLNLENDVLHLKNYLIHLGDIDNPVGYMTNIRYELSRWCNDLQGGDTKDMPSSRLSLNVSTLNTIIQECMQEYSVSEVSEIFEATTFLGTVVKESQIQEVSLPSITQKVEKRKKELKAIRDRTSDLTFRSRMPFILLLGI